MSILIFRKTAPTLVQEQRAPAPVLLFMKGGMKGHPGYVLYGNPPRWHLFDPAKHAPEHIHYHAQKTYHVAAVKKLMDQHHADPALTPEKAIGDVDSMAKVDQGAASASAAVSMWKKSILEGKKPTQAQQKAFVDLMHTDAKKAAHIMNEVEKAVGGHAKFMEIVAGGVPPVPPVVNLKTGAVLKMDSQYAKMNSGEWTIYNQNEDSYQMHKVGAKVPGALNTVSIPKETLHAALASGTAKVVLYAENTPEGPLPAGWSGVGNIATNQDPVSGGIVDENMAGLGWYVVANNNAISELKGKYFKTKKDAFDALAAAVAAASPKQMATWVDNDLLADRPEIDPHTIPGVDGWHASLSAGKVPTPEQHEAVTHAGFTGNWSAAVAKHGAEKVKPLVDQAAEGWLNHEKAKAETTTSQAEIAQAEVSKILNGKSGHYPGKAAQKLTGDIKWQTALPVEQLAMIVDLANQMQASASTSAAISGWKKSALEKKNPTPAQWKAFYALHSSKKAKLLDDVVAKHGGMDHLKAPSHPVGAVVMPEVHEAAPKSPSVHYTGIKYTKSGADWVSASTGTSYSPGEWKHAMLQMINGEPPAAGTAPHKLDIALEAAVLDGATDVSKMLDMAYPIGDVNGKPAFPQEGDEKTVGTTTYILKNGRWRKMDADFSENMQKTGANTEAGHNPASLQSMLIESYKGHEIEVKKTPDGYYQSYTDGELSGDGWASIETALANEKANIDQAVAAAHPSWTATITNTSPGHNKFYTVEVNGNVLTKKWGKIGTAGMSQSSPMATHDKAINAASDILNKKASEGYVYTSAPGYVGGSGNAAAPTEASAAPANASRVVVKAKPKKKLTKEEQIKAVVVPDFVAIDGHKNAVNYGPLAEKIKAATLSSGVSGLKSLVTFGKDGSVSSKKNSTGFGTAKCHESGPSPRQVAFWKFCTDMHAAALGKFNPDAAASAPSSSGSTKPSGPKDGDVKTENGKTYVLKDGRWHLVGESSGPNTVKPKTGDKYVSDMSAWKKTGGQLGSNAGGQYTDKQGQKWYVKFPSDPDVVRNEFLATKFYQMLGVDVPSLRLVSDNGKIGIASKWQDGLSKGSPSQLSGAKKAFAIDAWLANWDVVGLGYDNLLLNASGIPVRVDAGGAMVYRAQGGKKGDAFGDTVPELETLLDPGTNDKTAAVFAGITSADMGWGINQLAKLKTSQIEELVDKVGPGSAAEKSDLAKKLIARRAFILAKHGVHDPWVPKHPDMSKLPVNPADLPPPLNFSTLNGGNPVSSKPHVNDMNSKDSAALVEFASNGNLQSLKTYQYDAVDKETGAVIGKKPIQEHPSHHIQTQWAELVELLQSIAYPPVESLEMPSLGVAAALDDISDLVGYFSPLERVETVAAEHRMGFFMKAGHIEGVDELVKDMVWKHIKPSDAFVAKCKGAFSGLSSAVRAYISGIQSSGWVNHIFSQGQQTVSVSGNHGSYNGGIQGLAAQAYKDAVEIPEGTTIKRGMHDTTAGKSMTKQLLEATPGLVIQNTDSMCTSYVEGWGWGGDIQMTIRCGKGCRALPSFASGHFSSEHEITTLPGARFVLLKSEKVGGKVNIEVLMLPPHDGYVAELEKLKQLGKSVMLFFKR